MSTPPIDFIIVFAKLPPAATRRRLRAPGVGTDGPVQPSLCRRGLLSRSCSPQRRPALRPHQPDRMRPHDPRKENHMISTSAPACPAPMRGSISQAAGTHSPSQPLRPDAPLHAAALPSLSRPLAAWGRGLALVASPQFRKALRPLSRASALPGRHQAFKFMRIGAAQQSTVCMNRPAPSIPMQLNGPYLIVRDFFPPNKWKKGVAPYSKQGHAGATLRFAFAYLRSMPDGLAPKQGTDRAKVNTAATGRNASGGCRLRPDGERNEAAARSARRRSAGLRRQTPPARRLEEKTR